MKSKLANVMALVAAALLLMEAAAECGSCNASDSLAAEEEELLMESEVSRRILQMGKVTKKTIALNPKMPYCNRQVYGSCSGAKNQYFKTRPCDYNNKCGRKP